MEDELVPWFNMNAYLLRCILNSDNPTNITSLLMQIRPSVHVGLL